MADLLEALGWERSFGHGARLIALIGASTVMVLAATLALVSALGLSVLVAQASIWLAWLIWLGAVFPHNFRRDSRRPSQWPYRRAFMREILIGISIAFSQFLRPAVVGLLSAGSSVSLEALVVGILLFLAGGATIAAAVSVLGVSKALFLHEYVPAMQHLVTSGIYRFVRHPLFIGGALVSLGLAVATGNQTAIGLGLLNALVLPVYVRLEDRRCSMILGQEYVDYRIAVGGVLPRWRSAIRPVAHSHQAVGRRGVL